MSRFMICFPWCIPMIWWLEDGTLASFLYSLIYNDFARLDLAQSMDRAMVLEPNLKQQLWTEMEAMHPLPSICYSDFIAANQQNRCDNLIPGQDKQIHLETIRNDIRYPLSVLRLIVSEFKKKHKLETVIVIWTATTERFVDVLLSIYFALTQYLCLFRSFLAFTTPPRTFSGLSSKVTLKYPPLWCLQLRAF